MEILKPCKHKWVDEVISIQPRKTAQIWTKLLRISEESLEILGYTLLLSFNSALKEITLYQNHSKRKFSEIFLHFTRHQKRTNNGWVLGSIVRVNWIILHINCLHFWFCWVNEKSCFTAPSVKSQWRVCHSLCATRYAVKRVCRVSLSTLAASYYPATVHHHAGADFFNLFRHVL